MVLTGYADTPHLLLVYNASGHSPQYLSTPCLCPLSLPVRLSISPVGAAPWHPAGRLAGCHSFVDSRWRIAQALASWLAPSLAPRRGTLAVSSGARRPAPVKSGREDPDRAANVCRRMLPILKRLPAGHTSPIPAKIGQ